MGVTDVDEGGTLDVLDGGGGSAELDGGGSAELDGGAVVAAGGASVGATTGGRAEGRRGGSAGSSSSVVSSTGVVSDVSVSVATGGGPIAGVGAGAVVAPELAVGSAPSGASRNRDATTASAAASPPADTSRAGLRRPEPAGPS